MSKKRKERDRCIISVESASSHNDSIFNDPFIGICIIIVIAFISYFNTVAVPFIFDDHPYLSENPAVRSFQYFLNPDRIFMLGIDSDVKNNFILRPVSYFTFAFNYALHGYDVRGYHILNLLIHIGNAISVFFLVALTLRTPGMQGPEHNRKNEAQVNLLLPLFCALLFVAHPLQTQAVTYTIQRFTSLSSLFFVAALVMYVSSRLAEAAMVKRTFYFLSLLAAILAMHSKENAFMLPVVVVMYEFIFFEGPVARRVLGLIPMIATMVIIPMKLLKLSSMARPLMKADIVSAANIANFKGTSSFEYLMTQFGVIAKYLRLLVLPVRQNLLYDIPLQKAFFTLQVLMPLFLLLIIIFSGVWAVNNSLSRRTVFSGMQKLFAFGVFWFFSTLAVESSIIPLDDLIFEHRAYLPSIGFFMAVLALLDAGSMKLAKVPLCESKVTAAVLCLIVICCSALTIARNQKWQNQVVFWADVVQKSPNNSRAHNGLGVALVNQGNVRLGDFLETEADNMATNRFEDTLVKLSAGKVSRTDAAIREFKAAIACNPENKRAHINLGVALMDQGRYDEAITVLQHASRLNRKYFLSAPYFHLGRAYEAKGDITRAKEFFITAIGLEPSNHRAHERLGDIYALQGKYREAGEEYEKANNLFPADELRRKISTMKGKLLSG